MVVLSPERGALAGDVDTARGYGWSDGLAFRCWGHAAGTPPVDTCSFADPSQGRGPGPLSGRALRPSGKAIKRPTIEWFQAASVPVIPSGWMPLPMVRIALQHSGGLDDVTPFHAHASYCDVVRNGALVNRPALALCRLARGAAPGGWSLPSMRAHMECRTSPHCVVAECDEGAQMFSAWAWDVHVTMHENVLWFVGRHRAYLAASSEEPATCGRLRKGAFSVAGPG